MMNKHDAEVDDWILNEECGSCGGLIGPSSHYPWHYDSEDCRAIREPLKRGAD